MRIHLPSPPREGESLEGLAANLRRTHDAMRSLIPAGGPGIRTRSTSSGTTLSAIRQRRMLPASPRAPLAVVVVAGAVRWNLCPAYEGMVGKAVTGIPTDFARFPYDGVEDASYVSESAYLAFDWSSMPPEDGSDDRAVALYVQISETPGPVLHVLRA